MLCQFVFFYSPSEVEKKTALVQACKVVFKKKDALIGLYYTIILQRTVLKKIQVSRTFISNVSKQNK